MASLICSVHKGDLPINIFWLHNGINVGNIDGILVSKVSQKVSTLTMDSVKEEHAGNYTCVAENESGVSIYSAILNVNGIHFNITVLKLFPFPISKCYYLLVQ